MVFVQRKKTLLKEYEQSGKASVFVDKRIGEQNDELGEFDKAILRSQRAHQVKLLKFVLLRNQLIRQCKHPFNILSFPGHCK